MIRAEPCHCIRCGECFGTGRVRDLEDWSDLGYETCEECGGSGIVETCARCKLIADMEYDLP